MPENISVSPRAREALDETQVDLAELVARQEFPTCDYGDVSLPQQVSNDLAHYLRRGSARCNYEIDGKKYVVLTLYNQTLVSVLLQEETEKWEPNVEVNKDVA